MQLPVNPETIRINTSHTYEEVNVVNLGEYTVIGDARLRDFSFSSFFPKEYNPTYCEYEELPDPWSAVARIENAMLARKPIRLTITGTPINYLVTIRDFQYEPERAGNPGEIYYEINLKEYVALDTRRVEVSGGTAKVFTTTTRPDTREKPNTYTVKSGDTLTKIALRYGTTARDLYAKNKTTIGPDPNTIKPGQVLVL
nr:LysM peptidoglycan-binding domain-containing protein [Brevibacillus sp. SYP-B805]